MSYFTSSSNHGKIRQPRLKDSMKNSAKDSTRNNRRIYWKITKMGNGKNGENGVNQVPRGAVYTYFYSNLCFCDLQSTSHTFGNRNPTVGVGGGGVATAAATVWIDSNQTNAYPLYTLGKLGGPSSTKYSHFFQKISRFP